MLASEILDCSCVSPCTRWSRLVLWWRVLLLWQGVERSIAPPNAPVLLLDVPSRTMLDVRSTRSYTVGSSCGLMLQAPFRAPVSTPVSRGVLSFFGLLWPGVERSICSADAAVLRLEFPLRRENRTDATD